jgi:sodium transport system ATP-binding protein
MIEASGLSKRFKKVHAVKDASFEAKNGEITGLLGHNGAGKTTVLRMLYGLLKADAGTARIDGVDALSDPRKAQDLIGVLPDSNGLYQRLTPREHVRYYGNLRGMKGAALEKRIDELMELLDMKEVENRRTSGFSHGERMKVCLAKALVHEPGTVLLDEPTLGLDVMSTRSVRQLCMNLRDQGKCVLFSSHIMQEVSALCDKIVILAEGRVVASGTPEQILQLAGNSDLEEAFVALTERSKKEGAVGGQC